MLIIFFLRLRKYLHQYRSLKCGRQSAETYKSRINVLISFLMYVLVYKCISCRFYNLKYIMSMWFILYCTNKTRTLFQSQWIRKLYKEKGIRKSSIACHWWREGLNINFDLATIIQKCNTPPDLNAFAVVHIHIFKKSLINFFQVAWFNPDFFKWGELAQIDTWSPLIHPL